DQLAAGVSLAFARGEETVAPYYLDGVRVLGGSGELQSITPIDMGHFALVTPVALLGDDVKVLAGVQLAEARAAYVAVAVGCADRALRTACEWVETREQVGQAIKGFQAVRHHLANAHIAREQAWTAAIAAGHEVENSARWARQGLSLARETVEL